MARGAPWLVPSPDGTGFSCLQFSSRTLCCHRTGRKAGAPCFYYIPYSFQFHHNSFCILPSGPWALSQGPEKPWEGERACHLLKWPSPDLVRDSCPFFESSAASNGFLSCLLLCPLSSLVLSRPPFLSVLCPCLPLTLLPYLVRTDASNLLIQKMKY